MGAAEAIAMRFPTPASLLEAVRRDETAKAAEQLAALQCPRGGGRDLAAAALLAPEAAHDLLRLLPGVPQREQAIAGDAEEVVMISDDDIE